MTDITPRHPEKTHALRQNLMAYIADRNNNRLPKQSAATKAHLAASQPKTNQNSNIRLVNNINKGKSFEFLILFGELENLLLSMNRNDALVQNALVKLNDIRMRIFQEMENLAKTNRPANNR